MIIKSKDSIIVSAKPVAPLSHRANQLLKILQPDVRRRYKGYKKGHQQGLAMVWDNMMANLKEQHDRAKINA